MLKHKVVLILGIFLILGCQEYKAPVVGVDSNEIELGSLLSAHTLDSLLKIDSSVVLIDVRKEAKFLAGHLPNALNIWRPQIQDTVHFEYGGMMASKPQLEKLFSSLGIENGDFIVMYDGKGQVDAARLWWILYCYGYSRMALLDGGIQSWKRSSGELQTTKTKIDSVTNFTFKNKENLEFYSDKNQVLKGLMSSNKLIDCRSANEYFGEEMKRGAYRAGHIPNAIHADYMNCIEVGGSRDCEFKSVEELRNMYNEKDIDSDDSITIYCHSGVRSAHSVFVLTQLLGFEHVKNYDGSWIEWSYFEDLPITQDSVKIEN